MNIKKIKHNTVTSSAWSKGKTSEYYIFPTNCDYQNKDFLFRVSSATIDKAPASFTNFIGYKRYLAMLDGPLDISINKKRSKHQVHKLIEFRSEDDVISYSTGQDFNLMVKEDIKSSKVTVNHGFYSLKNYFVIVYAIVFCEIFIGSEQFKLEASDCLIVENSEHESYDLISPETVILAQIDLAHKEFF